MAHGKHFTQEELTERLVIPQKIRRTIYGVIGFGLVLLVIGLLTAKAPVAHSHDDHDSHDTHSAVIDQSTIHKVGGQDHDDQHGEESHADDHGDEGHDEHADDDHGHDAHAGGGHDDHAEGGHGSHGHGPQHKVTKYTGFFANFLLNNLYFLTLALGGLFFVAIHQIVNSGWHTAIKRVPEAFMMWLPFAFIGLAVVAAFGGQLYDWIAVPEGADALIDKKRAYLNPVGWMIRGVIFFGGWYLGARVLRKYSLREDAEGGDGFFRKSNGVAAGLVVFFGFTFVLFSIDWIKSLEPHWFSTMFGVYCFAGTMATVTAVLGMTVHLLRRLGYMNYVNDAHIHDLFKYTFGFSIFWGYIFIAQYMLIWYSNLPEETMYYNNRFENYHFWFGLKITLCFIVPFLGFMTRNAKRNPRMFIPIGLLVVCGHWVDLFLMIMPGSVGEHWHFGPTEIGMFLTFAGIFALVILTVLTKANLVPRNHPYLEESVNHSTGAV